MPKISYVRTRACGRTYKIPLNGVFCVQRGSVAITILVGSSLHHFVFISDFNYTCIVLLNATEPFYQDYLIDMEIMTSPIKKICSILIVFIAVFTTACDEKPNEEKKLSESISPTQQDNLQEPDTKNSNKDSQPSSQKEQAKINAYVNCYNAINNSVYLSAQRYFKAFPNIETGPTGKEKSPSGFIAVNSSLASDCKVEVLDALAIHPEFQPIDSYAKPFVDSVVTLGNVSKQILRYYEQGDYKDDNFQKGRMLHEEFIVSYGEYKKFSTLLVEQIEAFNDSRSEETLKEMEMKEGKSLNFYMLAIITKAKFINKLLSEKEFNANKTTNEVDDLQKMIDELSDLIEAKRAEGIRPTSSYSFMVSNGNNYIAAVKQRIRRLKDKIAYDKYEQKHIGTDSEWLIEGSEGRIRQHYNEMVKDYNRS